MALHGVLDDPQSPPGTSTPGLDPPFKQLQALMNGIGNAPLDEARRALVSLVKQVPMLCDARAFAAPAGMHDLPQILATAYYARTGRVNFATNYRRAINRLHWLLLLIQAENILVPGEGLDMERDLDVRAMQARLVERINAPAEDLKLPERLQTRITVTGRDLFPTPAAVIAAIGMSDKPIVEGASDLKDEAVSPRARSFVQFVTEIDLYFLDETTMHQLGPDASTQARYLGHMRAMLQDAAPRLAAGVMPCDRTPIVSPWYAAIVLAVRNYAITLAFVLGAPKADDASAVPWTLFSLSALGDTSVAAELCSKLAPEQIPISLRPFDSLFAARSKSMYVCAREQTGPWWVLLRATLSGLTIAGADALAHAMVEATQNDDSLVASEMHVKMRNAVMLCALMHTQTGMRVLGHRIGSANDITAFPLADMVSRIKDPVCGQTPIDMVMCTYSGTSDLAALASDDLAFNEGATRRQEYAWIQELSQRAVAVELPAYPPPTPAPAVVAETVDGFCAALKAMGLDYLDSCIKSGGGRISLSDQRAAVPFESAVTKEELLNTLCRASTAHASLHCGTWLTVAFAFAVELERHYQTTEWPLLRSPCCDGRAVDRLKDEAWLRSHFCYLTEQVAAQLAQRRHVGRRQAPRARGLGRDRGAEARRQAAGRRGPRRRQRRQRHDVCARHHAAHRARQRHPRRRRAAPHARLAARGRGARVGLGRRVRARVRARAARAQTRSSSGASSWRARARSSATGSSSPTRAATCRCRRSTPRTCPFCPPAPSTGSAPRPTPLDRAASTPPR